MKRQDYAAASPRPSNRCNLNAPRLYSPCANNDLNSTFSPKRFYRVNVVNPSA